MQTLNKLVILVLVTSGLAYAEVASAAKKKVSDSERIQRLERKLESKGLVDLLLRLENLQNEVQLLRGEVELQTHTLDNIKKRQRDLYVDIDRRLVKLERSSAGASAYPVSPPAAGSTGIGTKSAGSKGKTPSQSFIKEQKAYQQAFELLRDGRYDKSISAFRKFLKDYPAGRYAHIAQYWLGEANYAQRNFKAAIKDYIQLIAKHPKSPKVAEALLKIGYSYNEMKDYKNVKATLNKLIKQYPKSTEAGQAKKLLKKIQAKQKKG